MEQSEMVKDTNEASAAATPGEAKDSVVDAVFDKLTVWATKSLSVAKRGLEASARWLEAQAKRAGDLAEKIGPKHETPGQSA